MRFPTMWYVRSAKPQISLRTRAVWSEPLLVLWVFYDCKATEWTPFGVSKLKRRLQRLVRVYTCQNATLLEISYTGSYSFIRNHQASWTYMKTHYDKIALIYTNCSGHLTKMATMTLYGKHLLKSPGPDGWWPWDLVCSIGDVGPTKIAQLMNLCWPWFTLRQGQMHLYWKKR